MKLLFETEVKKEYSDRRVMYAMFQCEYCNKIIEKQRYLGLRNKSCGCVASKLTADKNRIHGESGNKYRLYRIWRGMKARCSCPKESEAKNYKDKGVKVCKIWRDNYIIFKIWALCHGYKDNLTLDRINCNEDYNQSNCRWVTMAEQQRNKNNNILNWTTVRLIRILYHYEKYTINELFKIFDITKQNLRRIIYNKRWEEDVNYGRN